jgi:hypothetical protein
VALSERLRQTVREHHYQKRSEVATRVLSNGITNQDWKGVCERLSGRTDLKSVSTVWVKQTDLFAYCLMMAARIS